MARPVEDRLWEKVDRTSGGCWPWLGSLRHGYGQMSVGSKTDGSHRIAVTHRLAYEFAIGPIPEGLVIDHLCQNRKCCNPAHLEAVPNSVNINRAVAGSDYLCIHGHEKWYHEADKRFYCRTCCREKSRRYKLKRKHRVA